MTQQRLLTGLRSPWAWLAVLLVSGVGLSMAAARSGEPVRVEERGTPVHSCIPVMETLPDGKPTGKISCASDDQVRALCDSVSSKK